MVRILVIDNYDSFVYTLVGYLQELGAQTTVVRNDIPYTEVLELAQSHNAILLSPGPGAPKEAGFCLELVHWALTHETPLLGVCLGHQAIAEACGARVGHAPELMHGKTSLIEHQGEGIFEGLPSPLEVTRYHSLSVEPESVPTQLRVHAHTREGVIMGLQHRTAALTGVQFHPESVLTQGGYRMVGNWIESVGLAGAAARSATMSPLKGSDGAAHHSR